MCGQTRPSLADLLQDGQPGNGYGPSWSSGKRAASPDPEHHDGDARGSRTKRTRTEDGGWTESTPSSARFLATQHGEIRRVTNTDDPQLLLQQPSYPTQPLDYRLPSLFRHVAQALEAEGIDAIDWYPTYHVPPPSRCTTPDGVSDRVRPENPTNLLPSAATLLQMVDALEARMVDALDAFSPRRPSFFQWQDPVTGYPTAAHASVPEPSAPSFPSVPGHRDQAGLTEAPPTDHGYHYDERHALVQAGRSVSNHLFHHQSTSESPDPSPTYPYPLHTMPASAASPVGDSSQPPFHVFAVSRKHQVADVPSFPLPDVRGFDHTPIPQPLGRHCSDKTLTYDDVACAEIAALLERIRSRLLPEFTSLKQTRERVRLIKVPGPTLAPMIGYPPPTPRPAHAILVRPPGSRPADKPRRVTTPLTPEQTAGFWVPTAEYPPGTITFHLHPPEPEAAKARAASRTQKKRRSHRRG